MQIGSIAFQFISVGIIALVIYLAILKIFGEKLDIVIRVGLSGVITSMIGNYVIYLQNGVLDSMWVISFVSMALFAALLAAIFDLMRRKL